MEKGDIKVNVNSKDISQSVVGGTLNNDALEKYRLLLSDTEKKHTAFMEKNSEKARRAEKENDTQTLMKITNEFMALYDEYIDARNSFLEKNPNSIVSADILLETFLESDGISITEIKTSFDKLGADAKESEAGKKLNILINRKLEGQITIKKILDSGKFPDFSGQTPNGKTLTLQQVLGKVTVIYFWASWDEASRERKSELINLYNEFHGKGLTIIGVSLDQDSEKWKNAVKEDKLVWHNISNLKGWDDPIVKKLGIYSIPTLIVLDKNGKLRFQSYAYWDEEIKINIIGLLDE
ncbi:peroxiredoxin family protein [Flavobacterium alkalisoli]|uniref:peroxiredoxin family protein n=1 Tax=Flavobacterium alkalisoli TaxID=2602769 RepID=UPI003A9561C5